MDETPGYHLGPEARVAVLRRHDGYAVAVVVDEGPYTHEQAEAAASELRRRHAKKFTKSEAAKMLGIGIKGVDYLRAVGALSSERGDNRRVLIHADSVYAEMERRNG